MKFLKNTLKFISLVKKSYDKVVEERKLQNIKFNSDLKKAIDYFESPHSAYQFLELIKIPNKKFNLGKYIEDKILNIKLEDNSYIGSIIERTEYGNVIYSMSSGTAVAFNESVREIKEDKISAYYKIYNLNHLMGNDDILDLKSLLKVIIIALEIDENYEKTYNHYRQELICIYYDILVNQCECVDEKIYDFFYKIDLYLNSSEGFILNTIMQIFDLYFEKDFNSNKFSEIKKSMITNSILNQDKFALEYIFRFIIHKELNYINDWKTDLYSRAFTFDQIKLFTIYLNKLINTQSRKYIENFINILEKIVLVIDLEQKFRIEYSEKGYITKAINDAIVEKFNGLIDEINSDIEYYEYYNLELKKRNPNIYGKSFQEKIQEARKNLIN